MNIKEIEQQKQLDKRQRAVVKGTISRLKMQFSFGKIKLWQDVYAIAGYAVAQMPENMSQPVTFGEVKKYCEELESKLEQSIKEKYENPKPNNVPSSRVVANGSKVAEVAVQPTVLQPRTVETTPVVSVSTTADESGFNNTNDYGLPISFKEEELFAKNKSFLFWFQKKCVKEALDKLLGFDVSKAANVKELMALVNDKSVYKNPRRAVLIIASTGTGKTFMQAALDRRLQDIKFADNKTWGHIKYLAITRNSVVEQTKRVLRDKFGINPVIETEVLNIEKLRTRAGQIWIDSFTNIVDGEEVDVWKWKDLINPAVVYLDECQAVKNPDSTQHKIVVAYSDIAENTAQVYISATPFTRVSEAKAFAIATKKDISHLGFPEGTKLSAQTWGTYSQAIAHPSPPDEYNEAAVERLMKDLDDYIVRVKGVRWQFNAINSVEIIDFENDQQRKEYDDAWQKYLAKKAKLEESVTDNPRFQAMIELGIFLAAAEYAKRHIFARRMYEDVQNGYAAVCAIKFKKTIIAVTQILVNEYGVSRDKISLIWGGGQTQLTAKQKLKAQVRANEAIFTAAGITMEDMMLDEVEDREMEVLDASLRLGIQSKDERQKEIDKFQSGKSLYCMYTYKAGGVGLSLHHTDEQTKEKVRRQKNGYAVVEDIHLIPTRPRKVTVGPTWSPIELVQGCGRAPRLTSLSDTIQKFLYFRGTVEEDQAFVVTHRLKCLGKVVKQHENWMDLIDKHQEAKAIAKARVEEMIKDETDEPQTEMNLGEEQED